MAQEHDCLGAGAMGKVRHMTLMVQAEVMVTLSEKEDDEALLNRFLSGEDEAFLAILQRYEVSLIRYLHHLTGQAETAKDLCQETFLKLIQKPPLGGIKGSLRAWLFRVAHNQAMDHLRKAGRMRDMPVGLEEQMDSGLDLQKQFTDGERGQRMRHLIGKLPEQMREVLCLRVFAGLRFKEIARVARMPLGTALWRMNKAVAQLRENLEKEGWL